MMMRRMLMFLFAGLAGSAQALSPEDLRGDGFREMRCHFSERCLIGEPCETAWRDMRWFLKDADGIAYRAHRSGRLQRGELRLDRRWEERSEARSILMPMREAVASHLTVFDGGGAIYSLQYAADPGSGQFLLGTCETEGTE